MTMDKVDIFTAIGSVSILIGVAIMIVWLPDLMLTPWKTELAKAETEREQLNIIGKRGVCIRMSCLGFVMFILPIVALIFS